MWGGTPQRNMINTVEKNIPDTWDVTTGKNIKWVAQLGSQSFGNPVVAGGKVFVGTNNQSERQPKVKGDKGVVMCFREADGKFLWQNVHDKLASGRVNDWPKQGICSIVQRRRQPRLLRQQPLRAGLRRRRGGQRRQRHQAARSSGSST